MRPFHTPEKQVQVISSRRNPLVSKLKSLATREGREFYSLVLLEGTHLLQEALRTSFAPIGIVATQSWLSKNFELANSLPEQTFIQEVTSEVLKAALSTVNPDGVATLWSLDSLPRGENSSNFVLVLDRLQDPGNLGTLFRTALAADIGSIWLGSGADPLSSKALRASAGSILHIPYERLGPSEADGLTLLAQKLLKAAEKGMQVVATLTTSSLNRYPIIPYWELDWTKPTVLVLGNEGSGLCSELLACCTHYVTLPHSGSVESLNVSAAAVPLLLERRRAKMIEVRSIKGE